MKRAKTSSVRAHAGDVIIINNDHAFRASIDAWVQFVTTLTQFREETTLIKGVKVGVLKKLAIVIASHDWWVLVLDSDGDVLAIDPSTTFGYVSKRGRI